MEGSQGKWRFGFIISLAHKIESGGGYGLAAMESSII